MCVRFVRSLSSPHRKIDRLLLLSVEKPNIFDYYDYYYHCMLLCRLCLLLRDAKHTNLHYFCISIYLYICVFRTNERKLGRCDKDLVQLNRKKIARRRKTYMCIGSRIPLISESQSQYWFCDPISLCLINLIAQR